MPSDQIRALHGIVGGSLALLSACAGSGRDAELRTPSPRPSTVVGAFPEREVASTRFPVASSPVASSSEPPSGCGSSLPEAARAPFARIFDGPVRSLAAGKPPRIAVVSGATASVFDGKRWQTVAPALPTAANTAYEIFFGRDNEPRLMGYRGDPDSNEPLESHYRRHRGLRWVEAEGELGPLGGPAGGLYGVLGYDDPEVVCKPRIGCLLKRSSGWTRLPAHDRPVPIVVSGGTGWALHGDRIERADGTRWLELEPRRAWNRPRALWADPAGEIWVVEADGVFRRAGERWVEMAQPLARPLDVWGSSADDVWLAGHDGAAHFNGTTFRCVPGLPGPLDAIRSAGEHLWLAGESGVWHARSLPGARSHLE
jgi:hypothetical protein